MKKIKVEVPIVIKTEKENFGIGRLFINGNNVAEICDFIKTEEGNEYFKKNMEYISCTNEEKINKIYKFDEYEVMEGDYE